MCCQSDAIHDMCASVSVTNSAADDVSIGVDDVSTTHESEAVASLPLEQDFQSPLARWFAEPSSFELVGTGDESCSWQVVPSRPPLAQRTVDPASRMSGLAAPSAVGPGVVMMPMVMNVAATPDFAHSLPFFAPVALPSWSIPHPVARPCSSSSSCASASTSASSTHVASFSGACDIGDVASLAASGTRLSASAARRRRRQKAAAYASTKAREGGSNGGLDVDDEKWPRLCASGQSQQKTVWPQRGRKERSAEAWCATRCAELSAQLAREGECATSALLEMRGSILRLSLDAAGCRLVQDALQVADHREAVGLVAELRGHIREVIASPHGNSVVQKMVEVLLVSHVAFVAEELRGCAAETAEHRYGCRVMCRLLEHSGSSRSIGALVDEALAHVDDLCMHDFGHHVVESVLEHGQIAQRGLIVRALCANLLRYSSDRNSTYVISTALTHGPAAEVRRVTSALVADVEELLRLACDRYGHHVVRALNRLDGEDSRTAMVALQRLAPRLQENSFGCRVLEELAQRFE